MDLAREIPSKLEGTIVIGIFQMQRGELINSLRAAATRLANTLLRKMTEDYQLMIKALVFVQLELYMLHLINIVYIFVYNLYFKENMEYCVNSLYKKGDAFSLIKKKT